MKRILLIDDDNIILDVLKRKIKIFLKDVSIDTAVNFAETLVLASEQKYDLIIIDNILSYSGEGEDLARQIRLFPSNSSSSIWVVSGNFDAVEYKESFLYLAKPFDEEKERDFFEKLKEWQNEQSS